MPRILIVEDDQSQANVYNVKLSKLGYQIDIAKNGTEAMERTKQHNPDLIILDLVMPQEDGFSYLLKLKNDPELKNIPVLVVSNLGQEEDIDRALQLGAVDMMLKAEVDPEDVIAKVVSLVKP